MTMITPSYLGETIEYSSLHACRSTLEDPTIQAYGDVGLRVFRDMDFLVRDGDLRAAVAELMERGYERAENLTGAQTALIQRLHGQDFLVNKTIGIVVEPHTRLIPIKMAFDIDYAGLWRRAQHTTINGATMLMMAPEDTLLALSIHGGKEMWWSIKWAADIAAFIQSHPALEWKAVMERARRQGCARSVLLATALAQRYFASVIPHDIFEAQRADAEVAAMVGRIAQQWQSDEPAGPPSNKTVSLDRLRLHDGILRRARYIARTLLLPGDQHVHIVSLPRGLSFGYVPLKLAHDMLALPLWRAWRFAVAQTQRCKNSLVDSKLPLALLPLSAKARADVGRYRELRKVATDAIATDANNAGEWIKLGQVMSQFGRHPAALECYDRAVAMVPDNSSFWVKRRTAMRAIGKKPDLPASARDPQDARGWTIRAGGLMDLQRFAQAVDAADRALALEPGNRTAARIRIYSRMHACDWQSYENDKQRITDAVTAGLPLVSPIYHRSICDSEAEHLKLALLWAKTIPKPLKPAGAGGLESPSLSQDKIRIAYLSSDFGNHAISHAIAACVENHDRSRFETVAISLAASDGSEMRRRMEVAFDRFMEVQMMSDTDVATMLRDLQIDIAVDLNGYTGDKRTGILAHRPAPVQVNYLGHPGTMALPFMDYIIADRLIVPEEHKQFYTESVVYLPHAYLPADNTRLVDESTTDRSKAGLPETGFVFACFNIERKISPEIFDIWMQLLSAVEGSVLWLKSKNASAMVNLRREARARGVEPERIVFAPSVPEMSAHLARHRLADLFLDTLPYNAHVTACDALWAGVPMVTCLGNSFQARVAASVLHAVGLPELVTTSLEDYRELALDLAQNPERLAAIRTKLTHNRQTQPLFDSVRYTRNLESAFTTMWERQQRGEPPVSFAVAGR